MCKLGAIANGMHMVHLQQFTGHLSCECKDFWNGLSEIRWDTHFHAICIDSVSTAGLAVTPIASVADLLRAVG